MDSKELAQRVKEQGQALSAATQTPADTIRGLISKNMTRITQAMPNTGLTPERLATVAFLTIRKNPALLECRPESLVECILRSAELGLDPGLLGHAYIVPYGSEATFVVGYQGMIELARRSGTIQSIQARPVFVGDDFAYSYGLNDELRHHPGDGDPTWENLTHVYLVAKFIGGGHHFGVMTKAQVEAHRDQYAKGVGRKDRKGNLTSPWDTAPVQMALKTVVRQEWKWLPISTEIRRQVAEVEAAEAGITSPVSGAVWLDKMGDGQLTAAKTEEVPETAPEPTTAKRKKKVGPRPGWCAYCAHQIALTEDATEDDLDNIACSECGAYGFTMTPKEVDR